jgi:hypothetical protein
MHEGPNQHPSTSAKDPLSREQLYELAWSVPMVRLAERYGVSSSYLARVCTALRVPRPERGYWTRLQMGKAPERPPLPPARPGDMTEWVPGVTVGHEQQDKRKQPSNRKVVRKPEIQRRRQTENKEAAPFIHPLLKAAKPLFLKSRDKRNGLLWPYKKMLVDIVTSTELLDEALETANAIFGALTKKGHRVMLASSPRDLRRATVVVQEVVSKNGYQESSWSPDRPTVLYIGNHCIGLSLFEVLESVETVYVNGKYIPTRDLTDKQKSRYTGPHHWKSHETRPTGRMVLQAYCPTSTRVKWLEQWKEAKRGEMKSLVPAIIQKLEEAIPELDRQLQIAREQAEAEQNEWEERKRRWRKEEARQKQQAARQAAYKELQAAINAWDEAQRIEAFFQEALLAAEQLHADEREQLLHRAAQARGLVAAPDALEMLRLWKTPSERL